MGEQIKQNTITDQAGSEIPQFTPEIVNKILTQHHTLHTLETDLYDILVQSQEVKKIDDKEPYYIWAYKMNPKVMQELYDKFHNTDEKDFEDIMDKLKEQGHTLYLQVEGQLHTKKIGTRADLEPELSKFISPSRIGAMSVKAKELGTNNMFSVCVGLSQDGLRIYLSIMKNEDGDTMTDDKKNGSRWYRDIGLNRYIDIIIFIRKWSGNGGDIIDKLIYE